MVTDIAGFRAEDWGLPKRLQSVPTLELTGLREEVYREVFEQICQFYKAAYPN